MKSRKAAGKTQGGARIKRPEEKASFISWRFALLCGGIGLALAALLIRVAYLQIINPDMLVKEGDMRSLRVGDPDRTRYDQRPYGASAGGQCAGKRRLG